MYATSGNGTMIPKMNGASLLSIQETSRNQVFATNFNPINIMRKEIESVCFPVTKVETVSLFSNPCMEFNSENAYAIVGQPYRATKEGHIYQVDKTLNFCSDLYNLLPNKRILEPLEKVM